MPPHVVLPQFPASPQPPRSGDPADAALGPRPASLPRHLIDSHGRVIRDLRLSLTDRCNFRCVYCMDPDVRFADPRSLMTVEEMTRVVRACMNLGVRNIRLTGGEPTVHPKLTQIIQSISDLGASDIAMTTNGSLCTPELMAEWKAAGLKRLTFSLDAVTPEVFHAMTRDRERTGAERVVQAIRDAIAAGLGPVKVNAVVLRHQNESEVPKLAALARDLGFEMRFIEYMPLDSGRHWDRNTLVPADEILQLLTTPTPQSSGPNPAPNPKLPLSSPSSFSPPFSLLPADRDNPHSTSETYLFADAPNSPARIGIIAPVTRPFCGQCSRLRITADAKIRPCLFSLQEQDLMPFLRPPQHARDERSPASESRGYESTSTPPVTTDAPLENALLLAVWQKQKGHGISSADFIQPARPMSAIGG